MLTGASPNADARRPISNLHGSQFATRNTTVRFCELTGPLGIILQVLPLTSAPDQARTRAPIFVRAMQATWTNRRHPF